MPDGIGGITFVSNNALFPRYSNDNVFESFDSQTNTLYIRPDQNQSTATVNAFSSGGILSKAPTILDGLMALQFQNNAISGSLNFLGTNNENYSANLSGVLI
ncbi:hypothetical protein NUACC26_056690 [Scytonema sp. NUACC26]